MQLHLHWKLLVFLAWPHIYQTSKWSTTCVCSSFLPPFSFVKNLMWTTFVNVLLTTTIEALHVLSAVNNFMYNSLSFYELLWWNACSISQDTEKSRQQLVFFKKDLQTTVFVSYCINYLYIYDKCISSDTSKGTS